MSGPPGENVIAVAVIEFYFALVSYIAVLELINLLVRQSVEFI